MQQSPSVPPLRLSTVLNDDGVPSSNTSLAVQLAHILDSTSPTPLDRRAAEAIRKFQLINTSAEHPTSPVAAGAANNISSSSSENAEEESLDFPDSANQAEPAMHASSSSQSLTALSASLRSPLGSPADSPSPMASNKRSGKPTPTLTPSIAAFGSMRQNERPYNAAEPLPPTPPSRRPRKVEVSLTNYDNSSQVQSIPWFGRDPETSSPTPDTQALLPPASPEPQLQSDVAAQNSSYQALNDSQTSSNELLELRSEIEHLKQSLLVVCSERDTARAGELAEKQRTSMLIMGVEEQLRAQQRRTAERERECARLIDDVQAAQAQIANLLAALAERDQRVASDQQRFDSENAEIVHLRSQLGQTNDILREAEARVDELHLQVMQANENTRKAEQSERNMERQQFEAIQRADAMAALLQQCELRVDELKLELIKNDETLARSQQQHIAEIEKLLEEHRDLSNKYATVSLRYQQTAETLQVLQQQSQHSTESLSLSEQQRTQLSTHIQQLEAQLSASQSELSTATAQIQQTQTNNTSLWKQLKDAESQSAAFSSQLSTQRVELEFLKRDFDLKNTALEQSQNNASQLQSQSLQLQQTLQQTNDDKVRLEHELTEITNQFNALQNQFNELSTQSSAVTLNLSHNHSELQREKASNQALTVQVASNEQLIRTLTSQNSQLLSQIEELQQKQAASQAALQQANSEMLVLRQNLESSQLSLQKSDSELQMSRQKNVELAQSLSQLLSEARESKQLSESLQVQHQLSVQQANVLQSEVTQWQSDSRDKASALAEAHTQLIEARSSARQFQEAAEFAKFELKSQQEIVSSQSRRITELEVQIQSHSNQAVLLQSDLDASVSDKQQLQAKLAEHQSLQQQLQIVNSDLRAKMQQADLDISTAHVQLTQARLDLEQKHNALQSVSVELASVKNVSSDLQQKLEASQTEIHRLSAELSSNSAHHAELSRKESEFESILSQTKSELQQTKQALLESKQQHVKEMSNLLSQSDKQTTEFGEAVQSAMARESELTAQLQVQQQQLSDQQNKIDMLSQQLITSQRQNQQVVLELEQQLQARQHDVHEIRLVMSTNASEVTSIRTQNQALSDDNADLRTALDRVRSELNSVKRDHEQLSATFASASTQADEAKHALTASAEQVQRLRSTVIELGSSLDAERKMTDRARHDALTARNALNAAKQHQDSALAQQAAEYLAKINDWKQKCEALYGMKNLAEQRFQQLHDEVNGQRKNDNETYSKTLKALEIDRHTERQQWEQDRAAIAVHRLKLESLVNELKTEIDRLQNEIRSADQRSAAMRVELLFERETVAALRHSLSQTPTVSASPSRATLVQASPVGNISTVTHSTLSPSNSIASLSATAHWKTLMAANSISSPPQAVVPAAHVVYSSQQIKRPGQSS